VLATLIAIQFGFKVVVICALTLYGIACLILFTKVNKKNETHFTHTSD
jgi:hypothetical protein